jgi:hypothetical protein
MRVERVRDVNEETKPLKRLGSAQERERANGCVYGKRKEENEEREREQATSERRAERRDRAKRDKWVT